MPDAPPCRFPVSTVKEIIRSTLKEKLSDAKYATEGTKELADLIKTKLKGACELSSQTGAPAGWIRIDVRQ